MKLRRSVELPHAKPSDCEHADSEFRIMRLARFGSDADVAGWRSRDVKTTASKSQTWPPLSHVVLGLAALSVVTDAGLDSRSLAAA